MTVALCQRAARPLVVLAVVIGVVSATVHGLAAQSASAPPPEVTAIGCIAQQPDTAAAPPTGHEQGAATGLALTRAQVKPRDGRGAGAPPQSAVPGSRPAGSGSGTTPDSVATKGAPATAEQSLWVVGAKSAELTRFVGKRVEVVGVIDAKLESNPGTRVTDAGADAARRSVTAPPEPPATAHPSAPTRAISVTSFRLIGETCS